MSFSKANKLKSKSLSEVKRFMRNETFSKESQGLLAKNQNKHWRLQFEANKNFQIACWHWRTYAGCRWGQRDFTRLDVVRFLSLLDFRYLIHRISRRTFYVSLDHPAIVGKYFSTLLFANKINSMEIKRWTLLWLW